MIITSTVQNNYIPYQKKINFIINNLLDKISPKFKDTNPILSGSYLLSLIVSQNTPYSDYDFYFQSKSNFVKAANILNETLQILYQNDNCITYQSRFNDKTIQLINSVQGTPQAIITNHDLNNSKIAYQNNQLFFTKDFIKAWANNELDIFSFQIEDYNNSAYKKIFNSSLSTLLRVKKYSHRYNLDLSFSSRKKIEKLMLFFTENKSSFADVSKKLLSFQDLPYSATISPFQKNKEITIDTLISLCKEILVKDIAIDQTQPW